MLDGMFSFVLLDTSVTPSRLIAARDPIGITTLYMGYHSSAPDTLFFSSEMKSIHEECDTLIAFPPGHFYDSNTKQVERYFKPTWWDSDKGVVPHNPVDYELLRTTLEGAVKKRLMSEVPSASSLESDRGDDGRWLELFFLISLLCRNRENSDFMPCGRSLRGAGIDQMQMTVWM